MSTNDLPTLISLNEAARMTSLSRTAVNRYRAEGRFPQSVSVGFKRIAFVRSEVVAWIAARIAERPAQSSKKEAAR
ncbi:AlpA family transcriptional regulator [Methylosinus sp. Ce-a6]|uniref:helix-turn-helix transcriptional regulator n=1 Tax=Methylosinus sp. Ce-a6 TaxID=2172005 RepID=UPI00135CA068|nr:AlpA family phage regulatory protein [Methylosinus sp. Ce-a6]